MAVYLLHFNRPYQHARHYTGYVANGGLQERLARHRNGNGARLMQVIRSAGIGFVVARIWPNGDRVLERRLKARHGASRYCPICRGDRPA